MDTTPRTVSFTWNHLTHLRIRQDVEKYVDGPSKCIGKLLVPSGAYLNEVKIFKSVSLKLALRLRSSPVTAVLARLLRSFSSFVALQIPDYFNSRLDSLLNERIDTRSGKIVIPSPVIVVECLEKLLIASSHLKCSIEYCTLAFGQSMMWLHLGHMNQHFLTLIASLSRLSLLSKSLLVYSCDLYKGLYLILDKLQHNPFNPKSPVKDVSPSIDHFLVELNLTPSREPSVNDVEASGRQMTAPETVDEPVLIPRTVETPCDASIVTKSHALVGETTPSSTIQLRIPRDIKKHRGLIRRLTVSSPKMRRIFGLLKRNKLLTLKKEI